MTFCLIKDNISILTSQIT